ncbi:MAG: CvpA family protein [Gallionellaceae bacterium]|jgi:membrane protein required for colicin V production|nr:CvpA family protein [Gallionellaceae bacterium]
MTAFDFAVIAIFLVSLSLGLWRGLVYEVLSLLGWPLAFVLSRMFAADVAPMMPGAQEAVQMGLAYAAVFIVALIVWAILVWLVSKLVKAVGLGWLDRILGGIFGIVRGGLVVLVLAWLAGLTQIPEQPFWRTAKTSKMAEDAALLTKAWLPDSIARRIHYGIRS